MKLVTPRIPVIPCLLSINYEADIDMPYQKKF